MGFLGLIAAVRAGDEAAAALLVSEYEPHLRRIIRIRMLDSELRRDSDSADVAQSVLLSFFVRLRLGELDVADADQLSALLGKMARNKVAKVARRSHAAKRDRRRVVPGDVSEMSLSANQSTPSDYVAREELIQLIRRRLTAQDRAITELRQIGKTWSEIAKQMGSTPDGIRVQYSRTIDEIVTTLGLDV